VRRGRGLLAAMAWVGPVALAVAAPGEPAVLDAFEDRQAWTAAPATDVGLALAGAPGIEGNALCLDIDFRGHGGYAVAKRALPIALPENYALSFWMRGDIPPNNLELKLADASGDNVWWVNRRDVAFRRRGRRSRTESARRVRLGPRAGRRAEGSRLDRVRG